jgi:hypothetical protein
MSAFAPGGAAPAPYPRRERSASAAAPLVFGAILDWYGARTAGAWGWAFLSLGVAGVGAVVSVVLLHRTPAAGALRPVRPGPLSAAAR